MDLMSTVFALIGIVLAIINYEVDLDNNEIDGLDIDKLIKRIEEDGLTAKQVRLGDKWTLKIRWCILLTSFLSLVCLIYRHYLKV